MQTRVTASSNKQLSVVISIWGQLVEYEPETEMCHFVLLLTPKAIFVHFTQATVPTCVEILIASVIFGTLEATFRRWVASITWRLAYFTIMQGF